MSTLSLLQVSQWSVTAPVAAGMVMYRRSSGTMKMVFYFLLFACITEISAAFMQRYYRNNMAVYNLYLILELPFWMFILSRWTQEKVVRIVFAVISIGYVGLFAAYLSNKVAVSWEVVGMTEGIALTCAAGYALLYISSRIEEGLFSNPKFWVLSSLLVYFSINTVLFSALDLILHEKTGKVLVGWSLHSVVNILSNVMFSNAFLCMFLRTNSFLPLQR